MSFPALFLPAKSVRHAPDSVCGMLRTGCATSTGLSVRHAPDYAKQESIQQAQGTEIIFPHWISSQSAQPIAKLLVEPDDFPFLDQIHGHNDEKLTQLASANPNGFPWLDALES